MEHIASVSRSSGLEKDGDTLKDFKIQEEYREFLQGKSIESDSEARQRIDAQENVLILFRKLREGIFSSRRTDSFALEVYETSLYLSVAFNSTKQTTPIISHLLPDLYLIVSPPHHNRPVTILISLVHHLVATYPSQSLFQQHLDTIPLSLLPKNSKASKWINSLARSLRARNFIEFERLTGPFTIGRLFDAQDTPSNPPKGSSPMLSTNGRLADLSHSALYEIIDSLRSKTRGTSWDVFRSAYREVSCASETGNWLARSLFLNPLGPHTATIGVDQWFKQQSQLGHVRPKEGTADKWIVCKFR
ncbi:hypothetical protein BDZ94DRAFT_1279714 [Collybia nuda]|uniref:Uncharacterized protein n=1 Tax=Collybia nuda TaxID=64659 RepID=A0A9P6CJM2_9AGAR|nr:hypothetical protein BDZ94DRAFT_1279714 [Collybia nuda]